MPNNSPIPKNSVVSKIMSSIKGSNTKLELVFRKAIYSAGLRGYRVNYKKLPGRPDIVFTKKKLAIFINGCYWHGCIVCGRKPPAHNTQYWVDKMNKNRIRDQNAIAALEELGYKVLVFWEHDLKNGMNELLQQILETLKKR